MGKGNKKCIKKSPFFTVDFELYIKHSQLKKSTKGIIHPIISFT